MSAPSESTHAKLMREMGSKSGEWDPIPPTQYEALMDKRESEEIRLLGALLKRTIGRADDGTRSAFARESNGRPTSNAHLALETGISAGNLSTALRRLEAQDRIRRQSAPARIYLRADVPAPDLGVPDDEDDSVGTANMGRTSVIRTDNFSARELQFLAGLQEREPERFRVAVARIVAAEMWGAQVKADAMAWAREREAEQRELVFTELGYTNEETRGRKKERPSGRRDAFQVPVSFEQLSVQKSVEIEKVAQRLSVQAGKLIVNGIKSNSVQHTHPYGPELQSSESQLASQGKVNAKPKTREAELKTRAAWAEIRTEINTCLQRARLTTLGALKIDTGTIDTMAAHLIRLDTPKAIREVLDVLGHVAGEIKNGNRMADGWGYLVNVVKGEVEKRLPRDLREQVKAAAAGKGMR